MPVGTFSLGERYPDPDAIAGTVHSVGPCAMVESLESDCDTKGIVGIPVRSID